MTPHAIRIGPAGWSYKDWEGIVYPPHGSRFDHLAYLSAFFDTIEINSPFYRIPPPAHSKSWARRVAANADFRFTTKVYRGFTHETADPSGSELDAFRAYLDPLADAGLLGAVLFQFPWSFRNSEESRDRLSRLLGEFRDYRCAVEVRHSTFQNGEFLEFLEGHGASWVNVDQPLFNDSVKPDAASTGPVGYIRLHGRNYEKWFAHAESWERYNYLYSPEEIAPWAGRIGSIASQKETYVITNNHFRGQAIVNAGDLKRALGQSVRLPESMAGVYGERLEAMRAPD